MRRTYRFYAQLGFTLLVCSFLIVPVIMSVMAGVTENFFKGISSGVTLRWVVEVWDLYADTIFLSLVIAIACLACTIVLGIPAAYVLSKRQGRVARMIEELLTLPLAIPGLAIALALIITYGGFRDFRSSWVFILVGHVLYTLPFMMRSVLAVLSTADFRSLEEGAASVGAGFWRRFFDIVIPNCRSGIVAGALMVVTLSVGEFNITWMMHTPETKTLPVGLADSYASMRLEVGSAYTVVFLIMIIPLLVALQLYGQPKKKQAENFDDLENLESSTAKSTNMRWRS
ncbi:MAG: ABC transporter permease [Acidiferrobacteraceae bacterium]|jgi:putative spermidine/putrescine transport system permease protein|nr:ABC transporter permease [Acidiferrobacteraceae bacterium]|tara:strand:+ start:1939 stop:2796 length:858 start_codon:yes stop_codon:yes gene_type:complete